ncbi:MAG: response regulator [Propionibacteriales bacterium]|nr:response regulator [Propionibacteriales bacterium]
MAVVAVVDDDHDLRELMAIRLRASGLQVHQSADGIAGLELIRGCNPDLVVLDWMMPGKTGIEVCRDLRSDEELASVPVLLVTARSESADREVGLAAGANVVLTKPFELRAFIDTVVRLLEESGSRASA